MDILRGGLVGRPANEIRKAFDAADISRAGSPITPARSIVLSQSEGRRLTALTNAAWLNGFSDFTQGKRRGGQSGPESISLEKHRTRERASR